MKKYYPEGHEERHLQRTANTAQCQPECLLEDNVCQCNKLKQCATMMTSYDMTLSVMGGYINTVEGDSEYGNFTVQDLNLFDVAGRLPAKIATIKAEAEKSGTDCSDLLAEFTTLCYPEASSCSSTNEYSHQLTTEQMRK